MPQTRSARAMSFRSGRRSSARQGNRGMGGAIIAAQQQLELWTTERAASPPRLRRCSVRETSSRSHYGGPDRSRNWLNGGGRRKVPLVLGASILTSGASGRWETAQGPVVLQLESTPFCARLSGEPSRMRPPCGCVLEAERQYSVGRHSRCQWAEGDFPRGQSDASRSWARTGARMRRRCCAPWADPGTSASTRCVDAAVAPATGADPWRTRIWQALSLAAARVRWATLSGWTSSSRPHQGLPRNGLHRGGAAYKPFPTRWTAKGG